MHIMDTLNSLKEFLEEELRELQLSTKVGNVRAPQVFKGYLPPKVNSRERQDDDSDFYPFVITRFINNDDELQGENIAHFRLVIGTYSQDEQFGWEDTVTVMDRIKLRLKEVQNVGSATLHGKIESGLFENQKKPLWHGVMDVSLKLPEINWKRSVLDDY